MEVNFYYRIEKPFGGAYLHLLNNIISAGRAGFSVRVDLNDHMLESVKRDLEFLGHSVDLDKLSRDATLNYARPLSLAYDKSLLNVEIDVLETNSLPLWLAVEGVRGVKGIVRYLATVVRDIIDRFLALKSKEIVTVSTVAARLIEKEVGRRPRVVPNQPLPGFGDRVSEGKFLCFPSSYYYSYQGLDLFLKAVKKAGVRDEVLLIGKADVPGFRRVVANGIRELAKAYSQCFAIVSPHRDTTPVPFFGSPTKVVDALATNKLLIVSDLPSIRETIEANLKKDNDCIFYIKPGDVDDLAEALKLAVKERPSCRYELTKGPLQLFWEELSNRSSKRSA